MVGRPVVQALHGDDDGGGLALGPEPADVVAGNQAGELLDALVGPGEVHRRHAPHAEERLRYIRLLTSRYAGW